MNAEALAHIVVDTLDDLKAVDIKVLDVRQHTDITDYMIIATGNSVRQVKAFAVRVVEKTKAVGLKPIGVEGEEAGEWILIDLGDVVVHAMQRTARDFYQLEKLWDMAAARRRTDSA